MTVKFNVAVAGSRRVGEAVRGLARVDIVGTSAGTSASATASILVGTATERGSIRRVRGVVSK